MEYYDNRLIALLDVLGFSAKLGTPSAMRTTVQDYSRLISLANRHAFAPKPLAGSPNPPSSNFDFGAFIFDTLVLVSKPIDPLGVTNFVFALTLIMETFFGEAFPLRGAVSLGDVCVGDDVFLSPSFKRLQALEQHQDWSGCVILPEAEDAVLSNLIGNSTFPSMRSTAVLRYPTPWKPPPPTNAGNAELLCLNWPYALSESQRKTGLSFMKGDKVKFEHTTRFLNWLETLEDDCMELAPEFQPARTLKIIKGRRGFRVIFNDAQGEPANPGCDYSLALFER